MKKLFLFDMDGTLTLPRGKMNHTMLTSLAKLQSSGWDIGIISGSDMDYIEQQCNILFDLSPINSKDIHFLPCNGTKYYKNFKKVWEYNMSSKLGKKVMTKIFKVLLSFQNDIVKEHINNIPLTGNFFEMRGSVLNWCPIGRNAMQADREKWTMLDEEHDTRAMYINQFAEVFNPEQITIKLGGETSFDIYPKGWNKTFPINKDPFNVYNKIYFAGDRCYSNGNDEELFNLLNKQKDCMGIQVNNVKETIELIEKINKE
jgi:phosphomannomutase